MHENPPTLDIIAVAGGPHLPHKAFLDTWLPRAVAHVRRPPRDISVALVGDAKMAALHDKFLHIPGPTDVLTFELEHDARGNITAGEIVLCVPFAARVARRRAVKLNHELLLYAVHGVLHLSGYNDLTPSGHARMHAEEDRILQAVGIGKVFAPNPPSKAPSLAPAGANQLAEANRAMPTRSRRRLGKR